MFPSAPLRSKFLEGDVRTKKQLGILKQCRAVLSPIDPERHLVQVGGQVFRADSMPCADDAALQERESVLDRVGGV